MKFKVLPLFLWQEGKHNCSTDLLAHGFDRLCAEELEGPALIPILSFFVNWWEEPRCSYLGE